VSTDDCAGGLGGARRFAAEEMVACEDCSRANAPTRLNCLYCGARLPADALDVGRLRPPLRPLEEWEAGYNVVLLPRAGARLAPEAAGEAAELLRLDESQFVSLLAAGVALPLARASSPEEAEVVERRLSALGLSVLTVTDEELNAGGPPLRARAFDFDERRLAARVSGDEDLLRVEWSSVSLLVVGRVVSKRVEVEERRARLGLRGEFVEARELMSDEAVLDVYGAEGAASLRVRAGSFDYSCLGARKGLLAGENFAALTAALRERAPRAKFDDSYTRARPLLVAAWPLAERTESGGLRRERPGKFNTEAVTVVSNEAQFTRYSRLLRLLARKGLAGSS
jgi:hypothetical protein